MADEFHQDTPDTIEAGMGYFDAMKKVAMGGAVRRTGWINYSPFAWQPLYVRIPAYHFQADATSFIQALEIGKEIVVAEAQATDTERKGYADKIRKAVESIDLPFKAACWRGLLGTVGVVGPGDWDWQGTDEDKEASDWEEYAPHTTG